MTNHFISRVVDQTCPEKNVICNMTNAEAAGILRTGDTEKSVKGKTVRMARSKGRPVAIPEIGKMYIGTLYNEIKKWLSLHSQRGIEEHQNKLYELIGQIVAQGIKQVTGMEMPVFPKRRFQYGAVSSPDFSRHFPERENEYRKHFLSEYE